MRHITRSQWYGALLDGFLNDPNQNSISLALYKSEIRRIEKRFPVKIQVGPPTASCSTDQRHNCIVTK